MPHIDPLTLNTTASGKVANIPRRLQKPKGTVSLANLKCRLPKSERKIKDENGKEIGDCCFRVDIDGAPAGHNKFIFATETTDDLIRAYS